MSERRISTFSLLAAAGTVGLLFMLIEIIGPGAAPSDSIGRKIDALPPSAAGLPSSLAPAPAQAQAAHADAYLGGRFATGRVARLYFKVAENVFLAADRAPEHLRNSAERWVDVEFPQLLDNGGGSARAILKRSEGAIEVGDIVEIKFAHKDNPRYFPVKEFTRVTELVAHRNEMLAQDYERRILARAEHQAVSPEWLAQGVPVAPAPAPPTRWAAAGR